MSESGRNIPQFTKKEYNCLLKLHKKPRTWAYLCEKFQISAPDMNIMFSRMNGLYYVEGDKPITSGKIKLNQIGDTVAQAEFDRRFDMYCTRVIAIASLIVSAASAVISAIK